MGHGVHMADDDPRFRAGGVQGGHIRVVHDEAPLVEQFGRAGIDHDHIRPETAQAFGHVLVPDGIAGHIERLFVRMPEDHAAGRPAGDDGAVASGRPAETDAREDGLLSQHFHPGEAGAPEHGGVLVALHEHGHRLVQRRSHAAVGGHVDMVGMHMGHDIGVHAGQDVGHRHGQVAEGHGQVQLFGAAAEHGMVAKRPHAAPGRQPGVGEEGLSGVPDAEHGVAYLLDLHAMVPHWYVPGGMMCVTAGEGSRDGRAGPEAGTRNARRFLEKIKCSARRPACRTAGGPGSLARLPGPSVMAAAWRARVRRRERALPPCWRACRSKYALFL